MKKKKVVLVLLALLIVFGCVVSFSGEAASTSPLKDKVRENFFDTSLQQKYSIEWSVFSKTGEEGGIAYPVLYSLDEECNIEIVQRINDTIQSFLEDLSEDYVSGTRFWLSCRVTRFDATWFSLRYEGEAWTPSRALGLAFALNFNMETGQLLKLGDVFDEEKVLASLGNGDFSPTNTSVEDDHPLHLLENGYRNSSILHFDENHSYDFYFDNNRLYLIISAVCVRYYTIYEMELDNVQ